MIPEIPDDDLSAEMYEETIRLSKEYGFNHYEVSSYAKGQQAISRHNFSYWQGMDYLGIGPGAHGRLTDHVSQQRVRTFGVKKKSLFNVLLTLFFFGLGISSG